MKQTHNKLLTAGLWIVLAGYAVVLVRIILLKYGLGANLRAFNPVPFRFVADLLHPMTSVGVMLKNILGNIAIFIPLGLLAPALSHRLDTFWKTVLTGLCVSAAFELLQAVFGLGATDIDDLILNTLGAALGGALYFGLFKRLQPAWKPRAAALVFLCAFGVAGVFALWLFAPGELPRVVEQVNVEILNGLEREDYAVSGRPARIDADGVLCRSVLPRDAKNAETATAEALYPLAEDAALYLKTLSYQYSPNGNIQKTICTYTVLRLADAGALAAEEGTAYADLWLDEAGVCTALLLTVYDD